jgi:phosphoglycerate dehydrogenase-like enzyme
MRILLVGGMATVAEATIRANLEGDHDISVLRETSEAARHRNWFEQAEVIVGGPLTRELAEGARKLRLFQAPRAGLDGLGLEWLPPHVAIANTFHHEASIAEFVLMAMLWFTRRPQHYDRELRHGRWEGSCIWGERPTLPVLEGSTVLLLGLGHIAREIVRRARAFGMRTIGVSRRPERLSAEVDRITGYDAWRDFLPEADFVVPTCPLTSETRGLVGRAELHHMRASAHLINVARAELADECALFEALRDGTIAGAALDVWYVYPKTPVEVCHPSQYPFHELPNVLLTPHVSAWTRETVEGRARDIADNINRLASGAPLRNLIVR